MCVNIFFTDNSVLIYSKATRDAHLSSILFQAEVSLAKHYH